MHTSVGRKYLRVAIIAALSMFLCIVPLSSKKVMAWTLREAAKSINLTLFYRVRFDVLGQSPKGRNYISLFDVYGREITQIIRDHPSMVIESVSVLIEWQPNLESLVNGSGENVTITDKQVQDVTAYLNHIAQWASPELKSVIDLERSITPLETTIGMTMNQAWDYLNLDPRFTKPSDDSYMDSFLPPEPISDNLVHWTLPQYPLSSIDFEEDVWEFLQWNNGVADLWELRHRSVPDCVVTIPGQLSDPFSVLGVDKKILGNFEYESRLAGRPDVILYIVYKPLNLSVMPVNGNFDQKELLFIVYPGYVDSMTCINQSEALLGSLHLSTDPHK